jgi:hypothetical protein
MKDVFPGPVHYPVGVATSNRFSYRCIEVNPFYGEIAVSERPRSWPVVVLSALIFLEAALVGGATAFLVFELLTVQAQSLASALALTVLTALAAVWVVAIAVGLLRGRAWSRGAAIVWQVLQIAVAVGAFQGSFARAEVGWLLLVPALVALVLLFTRPVVDATRRD